MRGPEAPGSKDAARLAHRPQERRRGVRGEERVMEKMPDYAAAIGGARAWRLPPSLWAMMGGLLWSHAMLNYWPKPEENGGEIVAACDNGHPAPAKGCSCGVYAWYNPTLMEQKRYTPRDSEHISGVVAGKGKVIRGHSGYWVAERVVVLAFFDDGYPRPKKPVSPGVNIYLPTKEDVAKAYGVPVITYEDYEEFCNYNDLMVFKNGR